MRKNLKIKTTIEKDTTLNFPVWHKNGTREAFLMHTTVVLDAIKKSGHFHDYKKAAKAYNEAEKAAESGRAVYPCSTVLEQGQEGSARRRLRKPLRKLL